MSYDVLNFYGNKVYQIKNFNTQPDNKNFYYNLFVEEYFYFLKERNLNSHNFKLKNEHNFKLKNDQFTQFLYFKFFYTSFLLFNFTYLEQNNYTDVWAYLNNKNNFSAAIHNHTKTSVINGVYYFHVPQKEQSILKFYDINYVEIGEIQTKTDDLLIFSCDLNHMPLQSFTNEYRIALNMEIICDQEVLKHFKESQ